MNPSTASNRLVKDVLFKLAVDAGHKCFQCGGELVRDSFSIEHKVPWLDSCNPIALYFDTENIAFSHHGCNVGARRKVPARCGTRSMYSKGCRCNLCRSVQALNYRESYNPEQRSARYQRTGS